MLTKKEKQNACKDSCLRKNEKKNSKEQKGRKDTIYIKEKDTEHGIRTLGLGTYSIWVTRRADRNECQNAN